MAWGDAPGEIYSVCVDRIIIYRHTRQYLRKFSHADHRVDAARLDQITLHRGNVYVRAHSIMMSVSLVITRVARVVNRTARVPCISVVLKFTLGAYS